MPKYLGNNLGATGDPVDEVHATTIKMGGQTVVATNDSRLPTSDQKAALAGSSGSPSASNLFLTAEDRARVKHENGRSGLTGGGATKLDGISTTGIDLAAPYLVSLVDATGTPVFRVYELVEGTDAESSPDVIRPDDYAGTSNEKVWKLRNGSAGAAASLILGGVDELNGDQIGIDFTPATYTPDDTAPEAGDADHLAAHLAGIDDYLADVLTSRTGVYRELFVPSSAMTVDNTAAPTEGAIDFGTINLKGFTLADAATKSVFAHVVLPAERKTDTAPKFKLVLAAAATGDLAMEVSARAGDDINLAGSLGTAHSFTHSVATADELAETAGFAVSPAGNTTGRHWVLKISRTGAAAGDTLAGNAYLLGVAVQFLETTTAPSVW